MDFEKSLQKKQPKARSGHQETPGRNYRQKNPIG
jgi:hypothetical protein